VTVIRLGIEKRDPGCGCELCSMVELQARVGESSAILGSYCLPCPAR
jgi:hypothetical protein